MYLCTIPLSITVQYMTMYDSPYRIRNDRNFLYGQF
jgi:hypothetical protein